MLKNINGNDFIIYKNFIEKNTLNKFKHLLKKQFKKGNIHPNVPPYQTYPDLHIILKDNLTFKYVVDKIMSFNNYGSFFKINKCWANLSKKNNKYKNHIHTDSKLTCVLYVQNKFAEFGTVIEDDIIIKGEEGSLVIFNPKIKHSICNIHKQLFDKTGERISFVIDLISKLE